MLFWGKERREQAQVTNLFATLSIKAVFTKIFAV